MDMQSGNYKYKLLNSKFVIPFKMARLLLVLFIGVICSVTVLGNAGNPDLQVFYKSYLIAVIDESAKMGVMIDYSSRLIVELNGKRGIINVVDISEQVRYYMKNETATENDMWSNFEDNFQKLKSFQPLLEIGRKEGKKSKLDILEEPLRRALREMFNTLGGFSPLPEELSYLTKFMDLLQGPLSSVFQGSGSFKVAIGLNGFTKANLALAELLNYSEENLSLQNVTLDASKIFKAGSGAEVVLNMLSQVGNNFDLIKVFQSLFISPEKVLSLLKIASSGCHDGLDGLLTILVNYAEVVTGKRIIEQLFSSVLSYNLRPEDGQSLSSLANKTLTVVAIQDNLYHNAAGFSKYVSILSDIINNNYEISNIITLLTSTTSKDPLSTLVNVMSSFYQALNIPHLFGSILRQYNQTFGCNSTPGNFNSQVIYKKSLIAVFNKSAKMAMILDYSSRLIVELNGKRDIINVVDISEQVRYFIKNETDTKSIIWSNFEDYFHNLTSSEHFLETGQEKGEKSKLDASNESVREDLKELFNSLGAFSPLQEELSFLVKFINLLGGRLSLVFKGSGSFNIASGLEGFIKVNLAVAELLSSSKGGGSTGEENEGGDGEKGGESGETGVGTIGVDGKEFAGGTNNKTPGLASIGNISGGTTEGGIGGGGGGKEGESGGNGAGSIVVGGGGTASATENKTIEQGSGGNGSGGSTEGGIGGGGGGNGAGSIVVGGGGTASATENKTIEQGSGGNGSGGSTEGGIGGGGGGNGAGSIVVGGGGTASATENKTIEQGNGGNGSGGTTEGGIGGGGGGKEGESGGNGAGSIVVGGGGTASATENKTIDQGNGGNGSGGTTEGGIGGGEVENGTGSIGGGGNQTAGGTEIETAGGESTGNKGGNYNLLVIYKQSLVAIVIESAEMGVILDYSSRLIVELNGKRGIINVVDLSEQVQYYMKNETVTENNMWFNFKDNFQKLNSLQPLLEIGRIKGEKSKLETLEGQLGGALNEMFNTLGGSLSPSKELSYLIKFMDQLNGPLSLVFKGSGSFIVAIGFDRLMKVNLAMAQMLKYSEEKLTPENINLDASKIFKAKSSAEVLLNVLSQAGNHSDLIKVFGSLFTSQEKVLSLLKIACSGTHDGLDGLITVLVNYAEVIEGRRTIEQLISSVLSYNSLPRDVQSLRRLVNETLVLVANQVTLFHNAPGFLVYTSILNGIIENNNTSNTIGLPDIISRFTWSSNRNPLSTLVNVLSSFYRALDIPDPFGSIKRQFNQTLGVGSTPGNSNHQIIYKPSLIAIVNKPDKMAMILDYSSRLIVELNGKRSTIIVVDIFKQVIYYLKNEVDTENSIWSDVEGYFKKLPSLHHLLRIGQDKGEMSKLDNLKQPVRENLQEIFNSLGVSSPLPDVFSLLTQFIGKFNGLLSLVYKGSGSFIIANGVDGFLEENLAVTELVSQPDGNSNLQVIYKQSLIAIFIESAEMGVILDHSSRLIVELNGKRDTINVVDISEQVRYYIKNEAATKIRMWSNFEDNFQKLKSLQPLLEIGRKEGEKSKLDTLKNPLRGALREMFNILGGSSPLSEELSYLIKFMDLLNGSLSLVFKGSGSFEVPIGLDGFTKENLALAELLNYTEEKLSPDDANLEPTEIFEAGSGAEVLLDVLSQTGIRYNLIKVFKSLFASPEKVLSLLGNASSGSHDGLDGLITILVNYAEVVNGRRSVDQLTSSVLSYDSRPWDGAHLRHLINRTLAEVAVQVTLFNNAQGFSKYVSILRSVIENNKTSNSISLPDIISHLTRRNSSNPLGTLVNVMSSFYQALDIPDPFGSIKRQFNQTLDGGSTPGISDHQIIYKPFLIAIVNKSERIAMIIDYSSQLIVAFNGKRGTIVVIDTTKQVIYYLTNETDRENSIWSDVEGYFRKLSSLHFLLKTGQDKGEMSKLDTLVEPIRGDMEEVFQSLGTSSPLSELLPLFIKLVKEFKGPFSWVYKGRGAFWISGGVEGFIKVNLAVAELLNYSKEEAGGGEGGEEECESGGKVGAVIQWGLSQGGGKGGAKKPWIGKGHLSVGAGNNGGSDGNKKRRCRRPSGILSGILGGRGKAGLEIGKGKVSFHIGRENEK